MKLEVVSKNLEVDLDLQTVAIQSSPVPGVGLFVKTRTFQSPINDLRVKRPMDFETIEYCTELLRNIQESGKIFFIDPSVHGNENHIVREWTEKDPFYILTQDEFYRRLMDFRFRLERGIFGSLVKEAVEDMDIQVFELKKNSPGMFCLRKAHRENENPWAVPVTSIEEALKMVFEH